MRPNSQHGPNAYRNKWHDPVTMVNPTWLPLTTLLVILRLTNEMSYHPALFTHGPQDFDLDFTTSFKHHHRHRHKATFKVDEAKMLGHEAHLVEPNVAEFEPDNEAANKDWLHMANDHVGELRDRKYYHPHWPIKREAVIEGDLVLGGLMMVHERSDTMTCGPVMPQGGVQALETMLYTLDIINNKLKLIPGVKLGAHVLDDCDKDTYGLEMAVDFIKGK